VFAIALVPLPNTAPANAQPTLMETMEDKATTKVA